MSATVTVIPIGSRSTLNTTNRTKQSRLPMSVYQVQDTGKHCLLKALRAVFDDADDALFELADNATSNQDQNLFFESMREIRVRRRQMETDFTAAIESAFANLANISAPEETHGNEEFSSDNLSLVQNDELEELVAVDSMIAKAANACGENLQHLSLRLDALVPLKVYQKNNPIGPDVVCSTFAKTAKVLDIDIKARLVLFRLFEKHVVRELGAIYEQLNALLVDQGVLPSLRHQKTKKSAPSQAGQAQHTSEASGNGAQHGATTTTSPVTHAGGTGGEVLGTLGEALSSLLGLDRPDVVSNGAPVAGGNPSSSNTDAAVRAPVVGNHQLLHMLSAMQHQHGGAQVSAPASVASVKLDIAALLMNALQTQGQQQQIGNNDRDVINLVNMLFEFILDDRNLAGPMKALIGRLQIPVLKVAMIDPSFFTKGGHPARRLLNEMATAALGWQEEAADRDGLSNDPLYKKIAEVVQRVLDEFENDVAIFTDVLADFMSFVDKERKRAKILEQRTIDAESGKAKAEAARSQVAAALGEVVQDVELPEAVQKILDVAWSNVLFLLCINGGTDSEQWRDSVQTAKDLIWSVTAPVNKENRQQLLEMLPRLLKQLRAGLESISYNPFEMTQLLSQLEKIHLQRLKSSPDAQVSKAQIPQNQNSNNPAPRTQSSPTQSPKNQSSKKAAPDTRRSLDDQATSPGATPSPVQEPVRLVAVRKEENAATTRLQVVNDPAKSAREAAEQAKPRAQADTAAAPNAAATQEAPRTPQPKIAASDATAALKTGADTPQTATTSVAKETTAAQTMQCNFDENEVAEEEYLRQIAKLTQGTWFEIDEGGGKKYRCRLAAIIKAADKFIFVNRGGLKVAEKTTNGLALAIKYGQLRLLDDGMLFDRALQSVIGDLRNTRRA